MSRDIELNVKLPCIGILRDCFRCLEELEGLRYGPAAVLFAVVNSVLMPSRLEVTRNLNNLNATQNRSGIFNHSWR